MNDGTQVWYLYLIECENGSLYAGITTDVERRYAAHLAGKGARYTRMHKPVKLIGFIQCTSKSNALKAELAIKKQSPAQKRAAILAH